MNTKEIKEKVKELKKLYDEEKFDDAHAESESLVLDLFSNKKYKEIVEVDKQLESVPIIFEVAYSYDAVGDSDKAEEIYEMVMSFPGDENNPSILNNLSNIKKKKGQIDIAFDLIKKAYKYKPNDDVIKQNYEELIRIMGKKEEISSLYKMALENLKKETDWAMEKLSIFLSNIKKDPLFKDQKIAIPKWQFKVLIGTDEIKADSLKEQWLTKGYIRDTNERDFRSVVIYEINPLLESSIKKIKPVKLNQQWFAGFDSINKENLDSKGYFKSLELIEKVNKKYQPLMRRDFDELVFNYFVKNRKSTIILAGSIVELIFTYYCDKKKLKNIEYTINGNKVKRSLYDCRLSDFLNYFQEQGQLKSVIIHIGNLARIYRNFIHPGNEIDSKEILDESKMEIAFHSTIQIMQSLIK